MSRRGREAYPNVRKWSGTLPDVREALSDVREWWEPLLNVWDACRMFESDLEASPDVREWLGGPSESL